MTKAHDDDQAKGQVCGSEVRQAVILDQSRFDEEDFGEPGSHGGGDYIVTIDYDYVFRFVVLAVSIAVTWIRLRKVRTSHSCSRLEDQAAFFQMYIEINHVF